MRASSRGNYQTTLKLGSLNDTNPANDSARVALDVTAQSAPPAAGGNAGGGGGGGRLEWLLLAACAALVSRRLAHARGASRTCHANGQARRGKRRLTERG